MLAPAKKSIHQIFRGIYDEKGLSKTDGSKSSCEATIQKICLCRNFCCSGCFIKFSTCFCSNSVFSIESTKTYAALIDGQLFSNLTSSNSSGTSIANPFPIENASRNVDFTISADSGIDLSLIPGNRRAVLAVPEGLRGHVTPNGTGTFSTNILLPENGLDPLFSIVNGATTTLINSINALINSIHCLISTWMTYMLS